LPSREKKPPPGRKKRTKIVEEEEQPLPKYLNWAAGDFPRVFSCGMGGEKQGEITEKLTQEEIGRRRPTSVAAGRNQKGKKETDVVR